MPECDCSLQGIELLSYSRDFLLPLNLFTMRRMFTGIVPSQTNCFFHVEI